MTHSPDLPRREALRLLGWSAASLAALSTSACTTGRPSAPPTSAPPTPTSTSSLGGSGPGAVVDRPPTSADWRVLSRRLDGALLRPGDPGFVAAHRLYDPRWDGVAPAAVARPRTAAEAGAAIDFASRFGLAPIPRGGGHSYLGASVRRGALVLDLRSMNTVHYQPDSRLATMGGGARLASVYDHLGLHGRAIAGGTCPTVGLAGLAMGGGFGVFDRRHGLTCDALTGIEMVAADGSVRQASPTSDPDLFWALRGGGGGTLGVVTRVTTRTFAAAPVGRWSARWPWSSAARVIAGWQRFIVDPANASTWANLHLDVLADGSRSVLVIGFTPGGQESASLQACIEAVGLAPTTRAHSLRSYAATVASLAGSGARQSFVAGSSVPARPLTSAGISALLGAVADRRAWSGERHAVLDPLGGAITRPTSPTAFPWRSSPFTVQWYANLPLTGRATSAAAAATWVAAARRSVRTWAPGAYVNYPSPDITDAATYLGVGLDRWRGVKRRLDPAGLFRTATGLPM